MKYRWVPLKPDFLGAWKSVRLKHYPAYPIIIISLIIQRNLATKIQAKQESGLTAVRLKPDPPVIGTAIPYGWSIELNWLNCMSCLQKNDVTSAVVQSSGCPVDQICYRNRVDNPVRGHLDNWSDPTEDLDGDLTFELLTFCDVTNEWRRPWPLWYTC